MIKSRPISFLCAIFILINMFGCEAFVRKFTRRPKVDQFSKEEVILVPQDYEASVLSKEQYYRKYFFLWISWQDELINALGSAQSNRKKSLGCIKEATNSLMQLMPLLDEKTQVKLNSYLQELKNLEDLIKQDVYGLQVNNHRILAERIKRNILRDFSYKKIRGNLR